MQTSLRHVQLLTVVLLAMTTSGRCEQNSRRAVTEHQLMHDRSQNIQSLKRLIWLSSAIEGLHTAQTRSVAFNPTKSLNLALNPGLSAVAERPQPSRVQSNLRDFIYNSFLTQLPEQEP